LEQNGKLLTCIYKPRRIYNCVLFRIQVRPSLSPRLTALQRSLEEISEAMEKEKFEVCKALGLDIKVVYLENSAVHGYHFRVTRKKKSDKNLASISATVISVQKAGYLFYTKKVYTFLYY